MIVHTNGMVSILSRVGAMKLTLVISFEDISY